MDKDAIMENVNVVFQHPDQTFDRLVGVANAGILPKKIVDLIRICRLFIFPWRAHEALPQFDFLHNHYQELTDQFFLPFQVVGIWDSASLVMLADFEREAGLNRKRFFLEATISQPQQLAEFREGRKGVEAFANHPLSNSLMLTWGTVDSLHTVIAGQGFQFCGNIVGQKALAIKYSAKDGYSVVQPQTHLEAIFDNTGRNVFAAFQEIALFNSPHLFVVKKSHGKQLKTISRDGPILRTLERPLYMLLERSEFHNLIGYRPDSAGTAPITPHRRRSHRRFLRSERFTPEKRNTWVLVKDSFVGPTSGTSDNGKWNYELITSSDQLV